MTDAVHALRAAAFCLFAPVARCEIDDGIKWVEDALAALPPGTNPALVCQIETLNWKLLEAVADQLHRQASAVSQEITADRSVVSKPTKRQRKARLAPADGLRTMAEAAAKLGCSIKTLNGHVDSGALKYVSIGHGTKRPRKMFTDADLNAFIETQTRKDAPCPSTASRARHSGTSISSGEVVAFTARPKSRPGGKPKK